MRAESREPRSDGGKGDMMGEPRDASRGPRWESCRKPQGAILGETHSGSVSSRPRDSIVDQLGPVNWKPCPIDSPGFHISGGSTHTTVPCTVSGALAVCRVSSRRVPGGDRKSV